MAACANALVPYVCLLGHYHHGTAAVMTLASQLCELVASCAILDPLSFDFSDGVSIKPQLLVLVCRDKKVGK
jgi:hypothetical protein